MGSVVRVCLQLAIVATAVKLLLIPTYRSTDFEVHRNWLAITHSLPISKWYVEATSEWTLDYPPFFAWFEWLLSQAARLVDPAMLVVQNLEYDSAATVLFQRGSVIVTDVVLLVAAYALASLVSSEGAVKGTRGISRGAMLFFLLSCNAGLLIVDHVHFQYNGVMMGVLLLSVHAAMTGRHMLSGLLFAVLLNLKHLFLYAAPAFFVYLLRHYCLAAEPNRAAGTGAVKVTGTDPRVGRTRRLDLLKAVTRLGVLGGGVVAIFAVSFGPFVALEQIPQVLRRLFPFGRGLLHSYWAANAWAPYAAADKLLAVGLPSLARRLGLDPAAWGIRVESSTANMAGGIVGVSQFAVLPQVAPAATAAAVLLALVPSLVALWRGGGGPGRSDSDDHIRRVFSRAVSYSFLCGFVFGYHVHEKAVLVALLPLAIDAVGCPVAARRFLLLSSAGHYGLLPLLFRPQEYGAKMLLVLSYFAVSAAGLRALHGGTSGGGGSGEVSVGGEAVGQGGGIIGGTAREATAAIGSSPRRLFKGKSQGESPGNSMGLQPSMKNPAKASAAPRRARGRSVLGPAAWCYLAGFLVVEMYCSVVHNVVPALRQRLPFAPLMLTSVYCSLGVLVVWADMALEWAREALR